MQIFSLLARLRKHNLHPLMEVHPADPRPPDYPPWQRRPPRAANVDRNAPPLPTEAPPAEEDYAPMDPETLLQLDYSLYLQEHKDTEPPPPPAKPPPAEASECTCSACSAAQPAQKKEETVTQGS